MYDEKNNNTDSTNTSNTQNTNPLKNISRPAPIGTVITESVEPKIKK